MTRLARTVATLEVATDAPDWGRIDDALQPLAQIHGVEQLAVKQRLERARWLTVELHLVGRDKANLRLLCERDSNAASQPPLELRGRRCILNELFD